MEIEIPKEISAEIEEASQAMGLKKKEVVARAMLLYIDSIKKFLDLKKELRTWDALSDEAWANFEKKI